jgi:5'-nucleotidase
VTGEERPDLVLTGVNRDMNVGEDVTYSGTVSAAMEAMLLGVPAIALSLEVDSDHPVKWASAEHFALGIIYKLTSHAWPEDVFMNVNIPNLIPASVKGVRGVNQGRLELENSINKLNDPRGRWYYWIGLSKRRKSRRNSDYNAIANGYIAVMPLHVDLAHGGMLRTLEKAFT